MSEFGALFNDWGKGGNQYYQKVSVSFSLGYQILESVVAPHDKIDVSRQSFQSMHFIFENVQGNVINLHGASVSLSLVLQTIE